METPLAASEIVKSAKGTGVPAVVAIVPLRVPSAAPPDGFGYAAFTKLTSSSVRNRWPELN